MRPISPFWSKDTLSGDSFIPRQIPAEVNPWLAAVVQARSSLGNPVTIYTLKNGHRILVEQRNTDVVSVRTFIDAGSVLEDGVLLTPEAKLLYRDIGLPSGITHLDEHCHFLTTEHFPVKNAWSQMISRYGADVNASTDTEVIQHDMRCSRENAPALLALHAESLLHPVYNPGDIGQEKAAVLNEVALRTKTPAFKMVSRLDELMFERSGRQTGGRSVDVATTSAEQLRLFYKTVYTPDRMLTVVSGNLSPEMVLSVLGPAFGNNPNRVSLPVNRALQLALKPGAPRAATLYNDEWSNSKVLLGFPAPAATSLRDRVAMEFLMEALDGGPLSPMANKLVSRSRLAFREQMGYEPLKQTGVVRAWLDCVPGNEQAVLAATLGIVSEFGQRPLSPMTLAGIRDRLIIRARQSQETVQQVTAQLGGEALVGALPYYLDYEAIAASITPLDVMRVARMYLNPQRYAVVFGLPVSRSSFAQPGGTP